MVNTEINIDSNSTKDFLRTLDQKALKPKSFLWFLNNNSWRLIIASDKFKNSSIHENYSFFIKKFKNDKNLKKIGLENITLVEPDDAFLKLLRSAIRTNAKSTSEIRFKSNVVNNYYIDDAIIYRLT